MILKEEEQKYIDEQISQLADSLESIDGLESIIDYACSCAYATGYCECMGENTEYKRGLNIGFELAKIVNNMGEDEKLKYFGKQNIRIDNLTGEEVEQVLYKEKRYI